MAVTKGSPRFQEQAHPRQQDESVGDYAFGRSPSIRGAGSIGGRSNSGKLTFQGGASQGRGATRSDITRDEEGGDED